MAVWKFDENRAAFGPASLDEIEADPCGLYILWRGDEVMVREDGIERPMPERLTVAGVPFDREQFEPLPIPPAATTRSTPGSARSYTAPPARNPACAMKCDGTDSGRGSGSKSDSNHQAPPCGAFFFSGGMKSGRVSSAAKSSSLYTTG